MRCLFRINFIFAVLFASCLAPSSFAQQRTVAPPEFIDWLPVPDSDRQLKSPIVEKDAAAEVLLWRVHVVDEYLSVDLQRVLYHYVRLKVFDAKGKDNVGTVELPFTDKGGILDVAGRTIKLDGSIIELDRKTVYKRDLVRAGGRKVKVVSFAMPGVEDGAILEYRWKQTQNDNRFRYLRLNFTRDLPIQKVTYFMKPLAGDFGPAEKMYIFPFNCKPTPLQQGNGGWTETSLTNIQADRDEPYAPSDANVKPWALLFYRQANPDPQKYWNEEAKTAYNDFKGLLKPDAQQKTAATQAVAGAGTDSEKIAALTMYVRKHLRNLFDEDVTEAERDDFIKKLPRNRQRTSAEIFKGEIALPYEMNVLFGALASQVGLDVRPALIANQSEIRVDLRSFADRYFVDDVAMAVKAGDSWRLFNVDRRHLRPGMLPAEEEGTFAIVSDPKTAILMPSPVSSPETSAETRSAKLKLLSSGSLMGDVTEAYTGHRAEGYRLELSDQSQAQREQWVRDRIVRMFPDAEIAGIKVESVDDASKPLEIVYHLNAPLFAQVTGNRLFLHPNVFKASQRIPFSASERRYPIQFPYAWQEIDRIQIELPDGFELESPDSPGSFDFGAPGEYKLSMKIQKSTSTELVVSREFTFGAKEQLMFGPEFYPALKKIFDEVQLRDRHMLSIKRN